MKGKKYITAEELKKHNKPGDLWISIQGASRWEIPLLNLAGQDVTDAFIAYHPGTAWKYLDKFFTGYYLQDFQVSDVSKDYRRLVTEFSKMGMFETKGHVAFCSLASVAVMFAIVLYGVLRCDSVWAHLGAAMVLGMLWIQSTYVGHDSGHYQVMSSRGYNRLAQIITGNCLTGISIAWWKWTHNAHHIACNSLDYDPDLQHIPFFAVSSRFFNSLTSCFYGRKLNFDPLASFLISYQHLTFYPVMCVARVNLYLQTLLLLFSNRKVPDRAFNIMGILLRCYIHSTYPVLLNHFSANVYVGPPNGNDWFEKQTSGTLDIACSSWMDWFFGGLQFQLEHHLFPRLPRCPLRKVSPVVKDLCKKHNLPYRSLSFWDANVSTIKTLRTAAMQARDVSNTAPKNLLWEAVNTHG
ncbi:hypothetical protein CXB51_030094 [Gossypium anomalum]|uniref:Cytochrome b5 heme-binding domain-containing protein n=1 Tax=Gossypium anomalum TaxID=47600 RepID=A0A8J5YH12_9ROSI|nr:hypothetical protein CXB51_030094 [Gossypium anomalum]